MTNEDATDAGALSVLDALRQEHQHRLALARERRSQRRQGATSGSSDDDGDSLAEIEAFVAHIQATGALVKEPGERRALQSILEYWASDLVARDEEGAFRAVPKLLAFGHEDVAAGSPSSAGQSSSVTTDASAAQTSGRQTAALPDSSAVEAPTSASPAGTKAVAPGKSPLSWDDEVHGEIIRLGAIARQWRREQFSGYLLTGSALKKTLELYSGGGEIRAMIEADHDISAFLTASQLHEQEALRLESRRLYAVIAALVLLVVALAGVTVWALGERSRAIAAKEAAITAKEAADNEATLRQQSAGHVVDELRKAGAGPDQEVLQSLINKLTPIADGDGALKGDRSKLPPQAPVNGAPEHLLSLLAGPDEAARAAAATQLVPVLNAASTSPEVFAQSVDRLTAMADAKAEGAGLSRRAALTVLAGITEAKWTSSAAGKAAARGEVAQLDTAIAAGRATLAPEEAAALQALKSHIGWSVPAGYRVDFQFAGYVRAQAQSISTELQAVGWQIAGEERTALAAGKNEIRYGNPNDGAAAALLAADLGRVIGSKAVQVVLVPIIPAGQIEVWISQ